MANQAGGTARELYAAADEALVEASFRTGDSSVAERLLGEVRARAARDADPQTEAFALGGLGMALHYRSIARLIAGQEPVDDQVAAEEQVMDRALAIWREISNAAGYAWGLFGVGLVWQVLRRDWDTAMRYFWPAFGLAEAVEESGDLYGCSEIHRHVGFYYLVEDARPREAVRRLAHSLSLRERIGDPRRLPSALTSLAEAELAAGNPAQAVPLLTRAVRTAREASLLPWRLDHAEDTLHEAEAALSATR
jgi:tetratricopeptide (TPR) repeat protein